MIHDNEFHSSVIPQQDVITTTSEEIVVSDKENEPDISRHNIDNDDTTSNDALAATTRKDEDDHKWCKDSKQIHSDDTTPLPMNDSSLPLVAVGFVVTSHDHPPTENNPTESVMELSPTNKCNEDIVKKSSSSSSHENSNLPLDGTKQITSSYISLRDVQVSIMNDKDDYGMNFKKSHDDDNGDVEVDVTTDRHDVNDVVTETENKEQHRELVASVEEVGSFSIHYEDKDAAMKELNLLPVKVNKKEDECHCVTM